MRERGSAILWILIATALFAAVGFTMMRGSGSSTTMLTDEQSQADAYKSADYSNAVNQAVKRLKLRGCADDQISYETPGGSNENPGAPADERCHVFRSAGGGILYQGVDVSPTDPCVSADIGGTCADGAIYVGEVGGTRVYAKAGDSSASIRWGTAFSNTPGSNSTTDGVANTDAMIAAGAADHPAAQQCRSEGEMWYVPAREELDLLWQAQQNGDIPDLAAIGINTAGGRYWGGQHGTGGNAWYQRFDTGVGSWQSKPNNGRIRCFRQ